MEGQEHSGAAANVWRMIRLDYLDNIDIVINLPLHSMSSFLLPLPSCNSMYVDFPPVLMLARLPMCIHASRGCRFQDNRPSSLAVHGSALADARCDTIGMACPSYAYSHASLSKPWYGLGIVISSLPDISMLLSVMVQNI